MNSSVLHKLCDMVSEGLEQGRESDARGIETKLLKCSYTSFKKSQTSIERGPLSTASISFLQILLKRENGRRIDKLVGNFQEV